MGTCWNCGREVTLQEGQNKCDSCGKELFYRCWNCNGMIEVKEKMPTCKVCGYYYCNTCGFCGERCEKNKWYDELRKIIPQQQPEIYFAILKLIENAKVSKDRKECINQIPITYAKGRIKSLFARVEGFRVKSENDKIAFVNKMNELLKKEIGFNTTITKVRENETYGQEYRDALNLMVCLGKFKISWKKMKEGDIKEYAFYERVDNLPCKYLSKEDVVINECPRCKKVYSKEVQSCSICIFKKGKYKGFYVPTKKRMNNLDTCQMYRGDFIR
jgi:hypothetical protein